MASSPRRRPPPDRSRTSTDGTGGLRVARFRLAFDFRHPPARDARPGDPAAPAAIVPSQDLGASSPRQLRAHARRWVLVLRYASPGMTKKRSAPLTKEKDPLDTRSSGSLRRPSRGRWRVARGDGVAVKRPDRDRTNSDSPPSLGGWRQPSRSWPSSGSGVPSSSSAILLVEARTAFSIEAAMSGFCFRNSRTFSRP